jgi:DNA primase small subunit
MKDVDSFNPLTVPTMAQLLTEINRYDRANPEVIDATTGKQMPGIFFNHVSCQIFLRPYIFIDWKKTSMKPYVEAFEVFIQGLEEEQRMKLAHQRMQDEMQLNF